jgi:hypothetical protein
MSAYRSELEAARGRLAAIEDLLADRDAELALLSVRKRGAHGRWWRSGLVGAGGLGLLVGGALCSAASGEASTEGASDIGVPISRGLTRAALALASAAARGWGAPPNAPTAPPSQCAPRHGYRAVDDLPDGLPGLELSDDSGRRSDREESQEPSWAFGVREHEEPAGAPFSATGAFLRAPNARDLQPLHFPGGRLLSLRESRVVLLELDSPVEVLAVDFRQGGGVRLPETFRVTLAGYDWSDNLVDESVLEYVAGGGPRSASPTTDRRFIAVEACGRRSLVRARLDFGRLSAAIHSIFLAPPPGPIPVLAPWVPKPDFD